MSVNSSIQEKALKMFINQLRGEMKKTLQSKKKGIWTGAMLDSLNGTIESDADSYKVEIDMIDYAEYVDQGVSGAIKKRYKTPYSFKDKKPPLDAIAPWAKSKGLNPFAVQYNIWANGMRQLNFIEPSFDKEFDKFLDFIAEAEADDLLNGFDD